MKLLLILLFILLLIYVFSGNNNEHFTVDFIPYEDPYFGFCSPKLSKKQFASGKYTTHCWNNYAYEDCELLNQNGYNCGFNIETGEKLSCKHNTGKCKDEPQCFSTCFQQVGPCKEPYMIQVERNNLIGLSASR